ncbi:hypothetical protein JNUCC23_17590 [Peribacillus sp. JNUCC 23]
MTRIVIELFVRYLTTVFDRYKNKVNKVLSRFLLLKVG